MMGVLFYLELLEIEGNLRTHMVEVPEAIHQAGGIRIFDN